MTEPDGPIARECIEGYLFALPPLELLLLRRIPARGRVWGPVQGKVEPGDDDYSAAACREIEEETGFPARRDRLIDLDWHVPFVADNGETWRLHAFALEVPRTFEPLLSEEHDAAEWLPVTEALARLHFDDNRQAVARLRAHLSGGSFRSGPPNTPNV